METLPCKGPGATRVLPVVSPRSASNFKYGSIVQVIAFVDRLASRADLMRL